MNMGSNLVDLQEAQYKLEELVSLALQGRQVILGNDGKPLVQLVPLGLIQPKTPVANARKQRPTAADLEQLPEQKDFMQ
jgi:antitoxin (DNA-binding transcriptional repressor) of toxin-antitoxin stability system